MSNIIFTGTAWNRRKERTFFFTVLKVSFNSKLENNFYKLNLVHIKIKIKKNEQSLTSSHLKICVEELHIHV